MSRRPMTVHWIIEKEKSFLQSLTWGEQGLKPMCFFKKGKGGGEKREDSALFARLWREEIIQGQEEGGGCRKRFARSHMDMVQTVPSARRKTGSVSTPL